MVYFTSDLHLGHSRIIEYCQRPFANVEEMNQVLIQNYNSVVRRDDTVYLLGDICLKLPKDRANELISQLHGKKYLLIGNHDKKYDPSLFVKMQDFMLLSFEKEIFALMHYPMLSWPHSLHGSYQLHGHLHESAAYNEKNREAGIRRYDVGVDANGYAPVSVKQVLAFFAKGDTGKQGIPNESVE